MTVVIVFSRNFQDNLVPMGTSVGTLMAKNWMYEVIIILKDMIFSFFIFDYSIIFGFVIMGRSYLCSIYLGIILQFSI
jgi:hypothetical protein